jgi:hypothetical protein
MSIEILPIARQGRGAFDEGRIQEHKPIGFPQDGGAGKQVSSLFYWAHAWSDAGGLIDQHPHEGFEIMSYVLRGAIEHYDSQLKGWKPLKAGDVQLIRAGDGIIHAEKILADSAIFQIWFDPNLEKSLAHPASYDDYPSSACPVRAAGGQSTKVIAGEGGPVRMETPDLTIEDQSFAPGSYTMPCNPNRVYVTCMIEGALELNGKAVPPGASVRIRGEGALPLAVAAPARWFVIGAPAIPAYRTYASLRRLGE